MAIGNHFGRAKVNVRNPEGAGECDRCGFWYQHRALDRQFQWQGPTLANTGIRVCTRCLDRPFEQQKTLILPPDPKPLVDPRATHDTTPFYFSGSTPPTSPFNQGFTVWVLNETAISPLYPTDKPSVLNAIQALSGITTPQNLADLSVTLMPGVQQVIFPANPTRHWMALYNPTQAVAEFALSTAAWNGQLNLSIGPGQTYFWSTQQNLQPVYTGAVSVISQNPQALWGWDTVAGLGDDGGVLYILFPPSGYPPDSTGLPPGAVYLVPNILPSDEYAVGVVPGITPNPAAPPVYFGQISVLGLLTLGGGNLPTTNPGQGLLQLWNNNGLICIDDLKNVGNFPFGVGQFGVTPF